MSRYELSSDKFQGMILLEYDESQMLIRYEYNAEMTIEQKMYFASHFPVSVNILTELTAKIRSFRLIEIQRKIPFQEFADKYVYETGDLALAQRLWEEFTETNKTAAIKYIPTYRLYLQKTGINKLKIENYLIRGKWKTGVS
jgi:hypothetical protein